MKKVLIIAGIAALAITIGYLVFKKKKPCGCLSQDSAISDLTEEELKEQIIKISDNAVDEKTGDSITKGKRKDELQSILKSYISENN